MAVTDYYTPTGAPSTGAFAASAVMRSEFDDVSDGFAKLPTLAAGSASRAVVAASNGLSLTLTTGTLALAGNFATTGAYNTTFVQGATVSITLPTVTGLTLATLTGTETLTNKTLTSPTLTTPSLGVATATSINGLTITTTTGTFTLTSGKTFAVTNTLTLSGTDSTTMTFPTTSATIARTDAANTFTGVQTMTSPAITTPAFTGAFSGTYSLEGTPTINVAAAVGGTWTAAATWTLPALTLGGTVSGTPTWSSSQAITLSTAAQPNVTSVGTLTSLTSSGLITSTLATGPQFSASGGTSNWITLGAAGVAAPAFTTRSAGTKVVLYENIGASSAGFAVGIESGAMWSGVPDTTGSFKWYGGTTLAATLTGLGALTLVAGLVATTGGFSGAVTALTLNGNTFTTGTYTLTGVAGKTLTFSKTLTLDGTDGTTMTFPTTSATIARTDAGQTFTGVQTMTSPAITTPAFTGQTTGTWTVGGTVTINAFTLAGTVAGGGNQINNVIIGTSTPLGGSFTTVAASTSVTVTSASAVALTVGLAGATNPAFTVDSSTASQAAGFKITGAATGGTVALVATDSGSDTNVTLNAKGSGTIGIGSVSTGRVTITPVTTITGSLTLSAALVYGGVTLSNAVTGTGNMVLSASPTLTGTAVGAKLSLSNAAAETLAVTGATGDPPTTGTTRSGIIEIYNSGDTGMASMGIKASGAGFWIQSHDGNQVTQYPLLLNTSGGNLSIGSTASVATVNGTTASTSTTTGALVVAGGVGVAGATYIGGLLDVVGAIQGLSSTSLPAGGGTPLLEGYNGSSPAIHMGSGAPTGNANKGSLYLRSDGSSTTTRAYINSDGGTTWTGLTTAA